MPLTKVYLTGATGRLGSAVLGRTRAIPLVRKPSGLKNELITDFSSAQLKRIFRDAACVIHLAGSVDTLDERKLQEANVELTRRVVAALPQGCRIVFSSSISVYGKNPAQLPADEDTRANPDSAYARSKYSAEKIVSSHRNHVILRIGTLYGPGFGDYYRVLGMICSGRMRIIGDGGNRIPFVHVIDAADAAVASIRKGRGTYVIAGEPLTQREIYALASSELGVPMPAKSVPRFVASALASVQEFAYHHLGGRKPPFTSEHVGVLSCDRVFDCRRARKSLGFSPRRLEQGIRAMVKDYAALGARQKAGFYSPPE
jgi:dihydroflavonol-4-reductase